MDDFEHWTRREIARLKSLSETSLVEAAALQRTLDKWIAASGISQPRAVPEKRALNGSGPHRHRAKRGGSYGDKNKTALEKLKAASPEGLTTDELYTMFVDLFGATYKRSSLRALLWHQKKLGTIEAQNGRYVLIQQAPDA
jgi:hypothetical protein